MKIFKMKKKIQKSFDLGARNYDNLCQIQSAVGDQLIKIFQNNKTKLPDNFFRAIDLGCGTGNFSVKILKKFSVENLELLDISQNMLKLSKKKIKRSVKILNDDFDSFDDFGKFDLIYSNMSLHWSSNIEMLLKKIFFKLKSNGIFIFSLPNNESFNELKAIYKNNNKVFNFNFLPVHENIINCFDLKLCDVTEKKINFFKTYETPLHFFKELKLMGTGVSNNLRKSPILFLKYIKNKINVNFKTSFFYVKKYE